jgi:quinoprotein glucose dehydrogenase
LLLVSQSLFSQKDPFDNYTDWAINRGDKKGNQYSELAYIHAANVHHLEPAWEYHAGDANERSNMHSNPIIIDGLMYFTTSTLRAVAIDAGTGKEVWVFKAEDHHPEKTVFRGRSRGIVYWESGNDKRIFHSVKDRVYALDAKTGELIKSFGEDGHLDLRQNLGVDPETASVEVTNPGIIYKNFLIVVSRVPEGYDSTPGHIRAYDTVTGEFKWIFHTIPQEGEYGYDTWEFVEGEKYGGANSWGGLTVDEDRGWVFASTGSPAFDFYGGYRKGMNLFGNCVLALDATTGQRIWHYQTVHHDLWDYDNPPAPILVTINKDGKKTDAVVQFTKMGLTFVLDRETGETLFPVVETPVPPSTIEGEEAWPTQPIPTRPAPLTRLGLNQTDLTNIAAANNEYAKQEFSKYLSRGLFTPPSEMGTISQPGTLGGVEWHGGAFDPYSNIIYVNSNDAPGVLKLRKTYEPASDTELSDLQRGRIIYERNCTSCHGFDRKGLPPIFPSVLKLEKTEEEIATWIRTGGNIMPAFPQFTKQELAQLSKYMASDAAETEPSPTTGGKVRYLFEGYGFLKDQEGYPIISPPWGSLTAIDLSTGEFVWKIPLGEFPELVKRGIRNTGTPNFGGAVVTAGGLIFIAATADEKIRAFEKSRGKLLWEYQLPAGGYATPSVYMHHGRQYVTIVCGGGGKNGTKSGDSIVTFALPETNTTTTTASYKTDNEGWLDLFDGETLDGWVHMNGSHSYTVENGAIVGRTVVGSENSFLCSLQEFGDFELELETTVDDITNQGIQFRSSVRPVSERDSHSWRAGRVWGPQLEIRRNMGPGTITSGILYGEALGTGWLSSEEKKTNSHDYFISEGWNKIRLVAEGPRMRTWVNGNLVEDLVREDVYKTHPSGFIGLQIHGIAGERQFTMKWRNIRIRPL